MKKISFIVIFVACVFSCPPAVNAAILGVELLYPDIFSNQTEFHANDKGADSQESLFSARSLPLAIHRGGSDLQPIIGEHRSYEVTFYTDDLDNFFKGTIGSVQSDLLIEGNGEILLTGELANFDWKNIENTKGVLFDFPLNYAGGALVSKFESGLRRDIPLTDNSEFTGDRQAIHQKIKVSHDTGAVNPIPATAWLLGAGLIAMVALRRKFNN